MVEEESKERRITQFNRAIVLVCFMAFTLGIAYLKAKNIFLSDAIALSLVTSVGAAAMTYIGIKGKKSK